MNLFGENEVATALAPSPDNAEKEFLKASGIPRQANAPRISEDTPEVNCLAWTTDRGIISTCVWFMG